MNKTLYSNIFSKLNTDAEVQGLLDEQIYSTASTEAGSHKKDSISISDFEKMIGDIKANETPDKWILIGPDGSAITGSMIDIFKYLARQQTFAQFKYQPMKFSMDEKYE